MIYGYQKWGDEEDPPKLVWIHPHSGDLMKPAPIPVLIYADKIVDHMGFETVTCGGGETQTPASGRSPGQRTQT